jgi:hypothetical protein
MQQLLILIMECLYYPCHAMQSQFNQRLLMPLNANVQNVFDAQRIESSNLAISYEGKVKLWLRDNRLDLECSTW